MATMPQPSRYRPRRPTGPSAQPQEVVLETPPEVQDGIRRSMSRYRKARPPIVPGRIAPVPSLDKSRFPRSPTQEQIVFIPNLQPPVQDAHIGEQFAPPPSPPRWRLFGIFSRGKEDKTHSVPPTPKPVSKTIVTSEMVQNGLGIDAPVSAINAGQRSVLVRYKNSSIPLVVEPSTTAQEIIESAATSFSQNFDLHETIIVESLPEMALCRSIRKYEHIRDVLNSWDRDTQHGLLVQKSQRDELRLLDEKFARNIQPRDAAAYLHHHTKNGKWTKVWVTLRSDGQVNMRKKATATREKDIQTICHLSDSDIYMHSPTKDTKMVLRNPKRMCFAIKSQHKSSMFQDRATYLHYFSTDDEALGKDWFEAVRCWRSWYLVNKVGETMRPSTAKKPGTAKHEKPMKLNDTYQIGAFQPLLSETEMQFSALNEGLPKVSMQGRRPPVRSNYPLTSLPKTFNSMPPQDSQDESFDRVSTGDSDPAFKPSGLLGRSYSQRQAAFKAKEGAAPKRDSGAFMTGNNLLNRYSIDTQNNAGGLSRSSSMNSRRSGKNPPTAIKTLLSFDVAELDTIRDPPQHRNKSRGYTQLADDMPHISRPSAETRRGAARSTAAVENPFKDGEAFTRGETLLRKEMSRVRRAKPDGHGTLLDLKQESMFAHGSLLDRVETRTS